MPEKTRLTANREATYKGTVYKPGDVIEASAGDVESLTHGDNPLARFDVHGATKAELEREASRRGLTVKGTGADGNVLVDDLRSALAD